MIEIEDELVWSVVKSDDDSKERVEAAMQVTRVSPLCCSTEINNE